MTEANSSVPMADTEQQKQAGGQTDKDNSDAGSRSFSGGYSLLLSGTALLISMVAAGVLFFQYQKNSDLLNANKALQSRVALLQDHLAQANSNLNEQKAQIASQTGQLNSASSLLSEQGKMLDEIQNRVTTLFHQSNRNSSDWLISQANFLVKLAGRKLWVEQDIPSAILLLKSADNSLNELNDPSLIAVRRLLVEDITTLGAIQPTDSDGLVLRLTQLAVDVDKLPRHQQQNLLTTTAPAEPKPTGTWQRWRLNLQQNWQQFLSSFITVRQLNEGDTSWKRPEQIEYLQENIRTQLLIAAQAVPRQQTQLYQSSLATVADWIRKNFATSAPSTSHFLQQLDELKRQTIAPVLPQQLKSQPPLEQLTHDRLAGNHPTADSATTQQEE